MAKKSRARRSRGKSSRTTTSLKKSLHDAQAVFARYFESGGKRVKETFDALTEIFESKHLGDALRVAPVGTGRASRPSSGRRRAAERTGIEKRATTSHKRTARK
jgi:hypothetical protein